MRHPAEKTGHLGHVDALKHVESAGGGGGGNGVDIGGTAYAREDKQ